MSQYSGRTKSSSTPSSILKKTPSLKSRLSQISNTPNKVRFVLPHSKKVRSILKDYLRKDVIKEYENLVCKIRDSEFTDEDILLLLKEATQCISLINQDLRLFVEALLSIDWINKNENVVREYQGFVVNLISAHNCHAEFVIDKLVSLFVPAPSESEWDNGIPSESDCQKCQHVHTLLGLLLKIVPMCKELLTHSLISRFPYLKKSTHIHEFYLQNLLWVIHYEISVRPDILNLILSRLIIMDVNAPREEIEKFSAENEDDNIFMMEDDTRTIISTIPENTHAIAHTLDVCLDKVFNYFYSECHNPGTNELNWNKTKSLYLDMLTVFDKVVLPTYQIHHVQFVMFFMCSFKATVTEAFLDYLWKKVCNPNVASVIRQAAVNYIVSFIARSTFIPISMVKGTLQQMSEWIHVYIANQDGLECVNSDVRVHVVFYTVCQALFYVIAFRHKDLVNTRKNIVFLQSLNMGKIVTSRLNPLRVCQPAVVQNFAAVTRKFQLAYCYSIIEHNSRNTLPTIYRDEKGAIVMSNNVLEAFYPFDPYILPRSGQKINQFYREYKEIRLDSSDVEMKEDNDDFLEQEMSASVKSQKFSYGSSPGFKFKT